MLKIYLTSLFIFAFAINGFSQTPQPTATPISDDGDVVKISTNLIQIDVSVTDKKGNPVTDLKPEDFEIYENGKKQDITNFGFISNKSESITKVNKENNSIPIPPTQLKPNQVRRTIALVVDDLTLSFESTYYVRRALKKFVDEQMQEGDLVAIIRTGAGIGALQQFTTDKRLLYQAIERVRWNASGVGNIGAFAPLTSTSEADQNSNGEESDEDQAAERDIEAELNDFRRNIFATGTLGALNYIVRGMEELPGRKSVMLFSDGFKLFSVDESGFQSSGILNNLKKLVDLANRASVVIYTMDGRGLAITGITAADNTGGRSAQQIQDEVSARSDELFDTQEGLIYLARETGGFAVINNNDLSKGVEKVLNDQSYYLIGYEPDDETFDAEKLKFNKFTVKVKREGVTVRYRSGFFGMSDEDIKKPSENLSPKEKITNALTSPFAVNEINLSLNTLFKSDEKKNLFLNSFLYINAKDFNFVDDTDGSKKVVFDVLAVSFGDNGVPVDEISKTYTINLTGETYQRVLDEGLIYSFGFPVKKAGAYQMRVVIRDHNSNKVGSANQFVLVPKMNKKRLTLSGVVLQNISYEEWNKGQQSNQNNIDDNKNVVITKNNPKAATSLKQFRRGTVLRYGFEIYNAKYQKEQKPQLETQIKVYRDGKLLFEGKANPINVSQLTNFTNIIDGGALNLGTTMQSGDYVLQIIVTDKLAKSKKQITSELIQFEIIE